MRSFASRSHPSSSTPRRWRVRALAVATLVVLATLPLDISPSQAATTAVLDEPVTFTVRNVNNSDVPCATDGKTYTVSGHITGPAATLESAGEKDGALYLHGLDVGEWFWRFPASGYDYSSEMAQLGHVSITIDRLGYNASSQPAGAASCLGGQAAIAHQIVQQLRAGTYQAAHRPRFARLALVGHSIGGAIAEAEAYSFDDVDALGLVSYTDAGLSPDALTTTLNWGSQCVLGGQQSSAGAPGYAYLAGSQADFKADFLAHTPASLVPTAAALQDRNPCGDLLSIPQTVAADLVGIGQIHVPVLLVCGTDDRLFNAALCPVQQALYTSSPDAQVATIAGATHGITLEPTAATLRTDMDRWLHGVGV